MYIDLCGRLHSVHNLLEKRAFLFKDSKYHLHCGKHLKECDG